MEEKEYIRSPWSKECSSVIEILETNEKHGLSDDEVKKRVFKYGQNRLYKKEKTGLVFLVLKQFASPLIFLLIGAVILSGILGDTIDMIVILIALVVNAGLGFYREYHAENTLEKLTSYIKDRTRVVRDGDDKEVDAESVVPGDIVHLGYGVRVPADIRLISVTNFRTDEAILTGESLPVEKHKDPVALASAVSERKNMAYAGTLVVEGYAMGVVCSIGMHTEIGKIAETVSSTNRSKTPIQKTVEHTAWIIIVVVVVVVGAIFFLGITRGEGFLSMLKLSAAVAVGAVPEALPIALTVILAKGAERIAKKKGIVRKLAAAETLGSATLIMTDKTGTLTKADMVLTGIHTKEDCLLDKRNHLRKEISEEQRKILYYALLSTNLRTEFHDEDPKTFIFHGRPFEVNIAKAAVEYGFSKREYFNGGSFIVPFNSTHKFSVIADNSHYIIMGAPDILLSRSDISKESYTSILSWIEKVSADGKRLVGIATMKKHRDNSHLHPEQVQDCSFLGILSFYDPIREDVPDALLKIETAGIGVVLVTGDLPGTALSVAKELGWNVENHQIITGNQLKTISDDELRESIMQIKIFARVTPEDKLRIGKIYQSLGEVVAMTGDGVNDAPALKAMDIGVSLGSGSDVAKSAADLVLLDDNFKTIALAITEGRKIIVNIRKTLIYLLSNSLDAVFVVGGALLFALPIPLSALQIIWVNFFTGSLPALAFAFDEDFEKSSFTKKKKNGAIFTPEVTFLTFGIGILSSVLLFLVYLGLIHFGVAIPTAKTVFFLCFASYVLAIAFSLKNVYKPILKYNPFSNRMLNFSVLFAGLLIMLSIAFPFSRSIFDLVPINSSWVWFIGGWIVFNVVLVECAKYILRLSFKYFKK